MLGVSGETPFYAEKWFLSLMIGIIVFPLTLLKRIEKLKFVSLLGMLSIVVFTVVIVINFFTVVTDGGAAPGKILPVYRKDLVSSTQLIFSFRVHSGVYQQ